MRDRYVGRYINRYSKLGLKQLLTISTAPIPIYYLFVFKFWKLNAPI